MQFSRNSIWVVCPVYRDVESFLILRNHLIQILGFKDLPEGAERGNLRFVVADDSAGLDFELNSLSGLNDVIILKCPFNLGHQRAIVFALRQFRNTVKEDDFIITMDSDGEDKPEDTPNLLKVFMNAIDPLHSIALAFRTRRRETFLFKSFYICFKFFFRMLTGHIIRTGNFACFRGAFLESAILHPHFDLCYSSSLVRIGLPLIFVPCERGNRYKGQSKMNFSSLIMHGIRMLMPFLDRIATRALMGFAFIFSAGVLCSFIVLCFRLFTTRAIPGWATTTLLLLLTLSFVALGNFLIVFSIFSQSQGIGLSHIDRSVSPKPLEQGGEAGEPFPYRKSA